ncbi:hypothetical protein BGW80DRAFT_1304607 [Lactifluus volemus]|nr:hypothetical protein BGW80DRAFT_1304607 [Lactifluus volemus]
MQPYYPPPSPYGTWAPPRPEPIPRPSSSARLEHHSPDVHSSPQTSYSVHPTKAWARNDTPTQIGRSPSALSHHSHQQAFESQVPPRIYKTLLQWKEEARAMTADYQRNGYPSAVAWVYVEGHAIPPNAIIGGIDRRGTWYIARAFYECSMELGKAGRHYRSGASIFYHGKEHDVDAYEVLVEANLPTRWVYQHITQPISVAIPSPVAPPFPMPETPRSLADFKIVVIIDDSSSMEGELWLQARDALAGVAHLSHTKGGEGLDIYCLNNPEYRLDLRSEADVRYFFDGIVPDGQTPIGAKLRQIFETYVPRVEDNPRHKPISVLVITDGVPTDDPGPVIMEYARRLDVRNVSLRQFGIQFIQIGDDGDAADALRELDANLGSERGIRKLSNTTVFSPNQPHFHTDVILKVVLGENHPELLNRTPNVIVHQL